MGGGGAINAKTVLSIGRQIISVRNTASPGRSVNGRMLVSKRTSGKRYVEMHENKQRVAGWVSEYRLNAADRPAVHTRANTLQNQIIDTPQTCDLMPA